MAHMLFKIVELIKIAESFKQCKDKKKLVMDKMFDELGSEKYKMYESIISELIDSLIFLHNNKEIQIFLKKKFNCCLPK